MDKKETIFLNLNEAIAAVCMDFQRYEPQIMLFSEVLRVLSKGEAVVNIERGKDGRWVAAKSGSKMVWLDGPALCAYVCNALKLAIPDIDTMTAVCSRVFREKAVQAVDPATGAQGIRIATGMEDFGCIQCGNCCKSLDYHDALTKRDVVAWREAHRQDILARVGVFQRPNGKKTYRIWTDPQTGKLSKQCPFLIHVQEKNRWICGIHEIKPRICRDYPVSRKHGLMTGCQGFGG